MKLRKLLALVLGAVMLLSLLTACGPTENTTTTGSNDTTKGTEAPASNKSYQLYGKYEEEGEFASMMNMAFLLDLNADGTAVCDRYSFGQYDASPADSNPSYTQSYLSGTWKEVEKDGVPCLQIKIAYVDEAGNESNNQTAYAYEVAGTYSFEMTFPVVPGMSYTRNVTMEGKENKTYATDDDFIAAYKIEFTAPENIGSFVDTENNGTAYLQADGTLLLYAGYDKFADGKWTKTDDAITISVGGEAVEVTMDGNKASFSYSRSLDGANTVDYTFVCEDITAIAAPEVGEDTPYTASVDMGGNETTAELTLASDGTANLKVFTDIPCTYTQVGSVVILEAAGELEGYAAQIWPGVSHAYILNEDRSMVGVVNAYQAGDLVLILLDETNMKVSFPSYGMERDGFTYTLSEDGTALTVTAPSEEELGAFGQVWAGAGAEKWTIDGNTATKAE